MILIRSWRMILCLPAIFALTCFSCDQAFAQQQTEEEEAGATQHVEESEEAYRQRMELRDQPFSAQPRVQTTYAVPASEGKLDELPPASRQHIKDQLRELIIDNPQWQPGDDLTGYPYEPSSAAKTDPALEKKEREAWAEQLQKYQEREAAAYANAQGSAASSTNSTAKAKGEQGSGESPGAQGGSAGQSGDASSQASGDQGSGQPGSPQSAEPWEERSRPPKEISTAGVSESALSFLQGKGSRVDDQAQPAPGESAGQEENSSPGLPTGAEPAEEAAEGNEATAAEIPGSMEVSALAQLQGMDSGSDAAPADGASRSDAQGQGSDESAEQEAQANDEAKEQVTEDLAGTLIIEDLKNIEDDMPQPVEEQPAQN